MHQRYLVLIAGAFALLMMAVPVPASGPALAQTIVTVTPSPAVPLPAPVVPAQPTASPLAALARETQRLLTAGLERTAAASAYRLSVVVRAAGTVAGARGAREEVLTSYEGDHNGPDVSYVLRSSDLIRQGVDPATGISAVIVGGTTYGRGPLPIHGVTEPVWYNLGSEPVVLLQPRYRLDELVRRVGDALDLATLTPGRTEAIEAQRCTAYQSGKDAVQPVLTALGRPLTPPRASTGGALLDVRIDRGAVILWHCSDGLLRRIQVVAAGSVRQQPSNVFASNVTIELRGINRRIAISAPQEAQAIQRAPEPGAVAVRAGPIRSMRGAGGVLGQLNVQEAVILIERSADQRWYRVRASAATGWVGAALLTVPPAVARQVPVVP